MRSELIKTITTTAIITTERKNVNKFVLVLFCEEYPRLPQLYKREGFATIVNDFSR